MVSYQKQVFTSGTTLISTLIILTAPLEKLNWQVGFTLRPVMLLSFALRSFTKATIMKMFSESGYKITCWNKKFSPRPEVQLFDKPTLGMLERFLAYQYLVKGKRH